MPGEVTMEQQGAVASEDLKKDKSHAQEGKSLAPGAVPATHLTNGVSPQIGPNGVLPNGITEADHAAPTTNGVSATANTALVDPKNPPQLDQSWRQHESNKSLGRMLERLSQKCYKDLTITLTKMSEIDAEPQQNQANGILPYTAEDSSEASRKRKRLILDFAKEQRDVFMKSAVLADWAKNAPDQGRLIDVKVWQDKQREAQFSATRAVGQTKVNMIAAKVPAPNIEGAMELLASGKAPWIPDMGYIPQKRLTAKQLLRLLRNMNVILATRLNLHEDLPVHFTNFSIADGRATFKVKDEFDVDLSVADEDPSKPFYFIDIRLRFTPTPNEVHERFRGFVEAKVNHELATKGLKGCYDFLHNFVVTHKINVLRSQSMDLIRSKWFDCIQPENMRRSFIVRYWCGMPGHKSWIEIGIGSGRRGGKVPRFKATPEICIRWFRRGAQITSEDVEFDNQNLSLEKCLMFVIRKHISSLLGDLQDRIQTLAGSESPATAELNHLESSPDIPVLCLQAPALKEPLQVRIDPITGRFSVTPPSLPAARVEQTINTNAAVDVAKQLTSLLCAVPQARLLKEAELLGWTATPNLTRQDNMQTLFGQPVRHISIYTPSQEWAENSALAVTFTLSGKKFWAVWLGEKLVEPGNAAAKIIVRAKYISQPDAPIVTAPSLRATLLDIDKTALTEVAHGAVEKALPQTDVPLIPEEMAGDVMSEQAVLRGRGNVKSRFIRFSSLMKMAGKKASKPWAQLIRLTFNGLYPSPNGGTGQFRWDIRLSLEPGHMRNLQKYLTRHESRELSINPTGGLAFRIFTPFGEACIDQLRERLQNIERLDSWLGILQTRRFKVTSANLSILTFLYSQTPELEMRLTFSAHGSLPVRLRFSPPATNPHQRLRGMLEQALNNFSSKEEFATLTGALSFSLPMLTTLQRLESIEPASQTLAVHIRTIFWYRLRYMAPLPTYDFQVKAKTRVEGGKNAVRWLITASHTPPDVPEALTAALNELWRGSGEHWQGMRQGAIADVQGCGTVLEKIDEILRRFRGAGQPAANGEVATEPVKSIKEDTSKTSAGPSVKQAHPSPVPPPIKDEPDVIMLD